jgi:hypothetical protein
MQQIIKSKVRMNRMNHSFMAELTAKPIPTPALPLLACALQGMPFRVKGREFSDSAIF